jgi:acetyl-CoA synthetase
MSTIDSIVQEGRIFPPPAALAAAANVTNGRADAMHAKAARDYAGFWGDLARETLTWKKPFTKVLDESKAPFYTWFDDGVLNVSYNCLDRNVENGLADKVALIFEADDGAVTRVTYGDLLQRVCRFANGLRSLGVKKGDRVVIYMPMSIEGIAAMQACARIGATHSVVFGGFSAKSLHERIVDAGAVAVITADEQMRGGKPLPLKAIVDEALGMGGCDGVRNVIVYRRTGNHVPFDSKRDLWLHELVARQADTCEPEWVGAEHPLFILYTSGSTGKPKGILHTTAGYLTGCAATHRWVFDLKDDDVYWCAADVGWVTGHSYIVYAPLTNGATSVLYEGAPGTPDKDRWWEIIARYGVSILYCAPTAIRTFMKWGVEYPQRHDMSSLRLLGSVGEPINPEAWIWYRENIGGGRCPVVDTWWQTETGAIMISPLPGVTTLKPGSATRPLPGITADVVDANGQSVPLGSGGYLVLTEPWPSMLRTLYGDDDRFIQTYWSEYEGMYLAGDGARRDDDGDYWLLGRIDDVMNVSGHRLSTIEIESALVDHPKVAEAAVVGRSDETTGQAIAAFVTLRGGVVGDQDIIAELRQHVATKIGGIARPKSIVLTDDLPKTRSGKIMRRLLRDISENRQLGDVTTLANEDVVSDIAKEAAEARAANKEE